MRLLRLWFISFLALGKASAGVTEGSCDSSDSNEGCVAEYSDLFSVSNKHPLKDEILNLAKWVVDMGGFINPNQSIDIVDDVSEGYGVIATDDFEEGEMICQIQPDSITGSVDYFGDDDISDIDDEEARLALALHGELFHPDFNNPYVDYLHKVPKNQLPEFWSEASKSLLQKVTGNNLPPLSFTDDWDRGGIAEKRRASTTSPWTDEEIFAYNLAVELSQHYHMTPILDLYNHRNGKYLNTYFDISMDKDGISLHASRNIKKGEQIYISYNKCNICDQDDDDETLGTPDLFHLKGFIENYPQRWTIGDNLDFVISENEAAPGQLNISFGEKRGPTYNDVSFLMDELERLNAVAEEEKGKNEQLFPHHEWVKIWKYHESLTTVVKLVIESYDPSFEPMADMDIVDGDDKYFRENRYTCYEWMPAKGYERSIYDMYHSQYQNIQFFGNPENGDKCLDLDGTLQICTSYRPHYHEPFVHFPAVFLSSLRRVVFVGGGDSMLLHEVLKYPSLELIVGLELDQKVVRNSFKHFNTRPHFHDDRVEWWFGDATKSLNIIPKEYFGSFDLVMVDLSETVMSFTVTKNLDMLEALALLTKPDGIFVKNEHYFSKIQTMFDHTVELHLNDNPIICDQHFAMGSNKIDFMQPDFNKIDGIETLLYKPSENITDHYDMLIQYSHNDAKSQGKCGNRDKGDDTDLPNDSIPGIVLILDAEQSSGASEPLEIIEQNLKILVQENGLTIISSKIQKNKNDQTLVTVAMVEGFLIARIWEKLDYIAFDIHLWGRFDKLNSIKYSLLDIFGSKDWSSFRVVVGGMIGSRTWDDDRPKVGPNIVNSRNCDVSVEGEIPDIENNNILALKESSTIVNSSNAILILCGSNDAQSCQSLQALKDSQETLNLFTLFDCPLDRSKEASNDKESFYICDEDFELAVYTAAVTKGNIGTIYIDESASSLMTKRVVEISLRKKHRDLSFCPSLLYIAPQLQYFSKEREAILPNIRRRFFKERISLVEIKLWDSNEKMITFLAINHIGFFSHVDQMKNQIVDATGLNIEISSLKGDQIKHQYDFSPHFYDIDDYDRKPGMKQYFSQRSQGYQTIFQLQIESENMKSSKVLFNTFNTRILDKNYEIIDTTVLDTVGDGFLAIYYMQEGQVIVTWNGGARVDVNIFTYENAEVKNHEEFLDVMFLKRAHLILILRDEQPRGIGRVVNQRSETDIYNGSIACHDDYYFCSEMAKANLCEKDDQKEFMQHRCKASCGICDTI